MQECCMQPSLSKHGGNAVDFRLQVCPNTHTLVEHRPWLAPADGSFLYSSTSCLSRRSLLCSRCTSCWMSAVTPAMMRDSSGATLDLPGRLQNLLGGLGAIVASHSQLLHRYAIPYQHDAGTAPAWRSLEFQHSAQSSSSYTCCPSPASTLQALAAKLLVHCLLLTADTPAAG